MNFPEPEIIAANDIELEVFSAGSGRPIVLCHGWPEHAYSWRYQVEPLVQAGYHVIVPNQRGYGRSTRPDDVPAYAIEHLTADLAGLLDHFGYEQALFVGHDWGAIVVWNMAMMHPNRVSGVVNLSVPFMARGEREWVEFWESALSGDFYIVHFNRQPGVADACFDANCEQFLRNIYRTGQWLEPAPEPPAGMPFLAIAERTEMPGKPLMSDAELQVFVDAFQHAGFTGGINWYRNFTRNWHTLAAYEQRIEQPTLMIYGQYDSVPQSATLADHVADLTTVTLPCGHWIQQEEPDATSEAILNWTRENYPA